MVGWTRNLACLLGGRPGWLARWLLLAAKMGHIPYHIVYRDGVRAKLNRANPTLCVQFGYTQHSTAYSLVNTPSSISKRCYLHRHGQHIPLHKPEINATAQTHSIWMVLTMMRVTRNSPDFTAGYAALIDLAPNQFQLQARTMW